MVVTIIGWKILTWKPLRELLISIPVYSILPASFGGQCWLGDHAASRFMDLPCDSTDCSCSGRVCCVSGGLNGLDVSVAPRLCVCVCVREREKEREVSQCTPRLLNINAMDTQRQIRPCALCALSQHPCPLPARWQKHLPPLPAHTHQLWQSQLSPDIVTNPLTDTVTSGWDPLPYTDNQMACSVIVWVDLGRYSIFVNLSFSPTKMGVKIGNSQTC